jgi:hypothetical protein
MQLPMLTSPVGEAIASWAEALCWPEPNNNAKTRNPTKPSAAK